MPDTPDGRSFREVYAELLDREARLICGNRSFVDFGRDVRISDRLFLIDPIPPSYLGAPRATPTATELEPVVTFNRGEVSPILSVGRVVRFSEVPDPMSWPSEGVRELMEQDRQDAISRASLQVLDRRTSGPWSRPGNPIVDGQPTEIPADLVAETAAERLAPVAEERPLSRKEAYEEWRARSAALIEEHREAHE